MEGARGQIFQVDFVQLEGFPEHELRSSTGDNLSFVAEGPVTLCFVLWGEHVPLLF